MALVLDLDGVLWLGSSPIPGSADAVAALRAAGHEIVFCTNNSNGTVADVEAKLARHGVPAEGDVITSAMAAASLLEPGGRALVCAGPGVVEAVQRRGAIPVTEGPADAVLVGLHFDFDYDALRRAAAAVRGGARLIGTNSDPTYPTVDGLLPGGGSLLAAVATASETVPEVAGKPNEAMARLVRERFGDDGTVVGDRPDTDGAFAVTLGYRFALVLSGSTPDAEGADPTPDLVGADLADLLDRL